MKNKRLFSRISLIIATFLTIASFTGCESTNAETVTDTETSQEQTEESSNIEIIEAGKDYDYNEKCKVASTYDTYNVQAPVDKIVSECLKDSYESMVLTSHSVENNQNALTDSVVLDVNAGNATGLAPQTIKMNVVFEKEGDDWKIKQSDWDEWNVETKYLGGSNWYASGEKLDNNWFSESDKEGEIYIHFKNNLKYIAVQKDENAEGIEGTAVTKFNGTISKLNGEEKEEVSFSCEKGRIDDDGNIEFLLTTENGEGYFKSDEFKSITQLEYDVAFSDNPEELLNMLTLDKLSTFNASSESLKDGEWIQETGSKYGNVSPELTWDEVDGATRYAILMMDPDAGVGPHVHWYVTVEGTHVDAGSFDGNEEGYVGPHPPRTHEYDVYIFALKEESSAKFILDAAGEDIDERARRIDEKVNGESGNIISYALVSGVYTYTIIY